MRWRVICLGLVGCGRIGFGSTGQGADPDAASDTVLDASLGPNAGFGDPVLVPGVVGADPQLREDGLEVWLADQTPYDLLVARRATRADPFGLLAVDPTSEAGTDETDPALSGDGLVMMFIVTDSASRRAYEVRRGLLGDPWGPRQLVLGFENQYVDSIDLLPDGDTLYYVDEALALRRAQRPARSSAFPIGDVVPTPPMVRFPTVSGDERVLFYNSTDTGGTRWAARAASDQPFVDRGAFDGVPGCAASDSEDADLAPDQHTLIIRCPQLYVLTRP